MSDYPAGAENDPDAPYNEKDHGDCSTCEGTGYDIKDTEDKHYCPDCDGTGKKSEQQAQDEYESFKEDTNEL